MRNGSRNRSRITRKLNTESLEYRHLMAGDLMSLLPAHQATYVGANDNLRLTFSEEVKPGTGVVALLDGQGQLVESINIQDTARVTFAQNVVTIDPAALLKFESKYAVRVDAGAIRYTSKDLFREGFDQLPLEPFVSPTEQNGDGTDWTESLPTGWARDNTDTPDSGPIEFFGLTVLDKGSWIATSGNQDRDKFTRGTGSIIVADGDEYDDGTDIDPDLFNSFLTTPTISLAGVAPDSAFLEFDSSFRPYDTMTGLVEISTDGGKTWNELRRFDGKTVPSDLAGVNEHVSINLGTRVGGDVKFRFGAVDMGDDWWWAFDNVSIRQVVTAGGDAFGGLPSTSWTFATGPNFQPATRATDVSPAGNLTITYNQNVKKTPGQGDIEIRKRSDNSLFERIAVSSNRVTVSGSIVTIDPVKDLGAGESYYVLMDDFSIWDTSSTSGAGVTLFAEDFDDIPRKDSPLNNNTAIDNYVVRMKGKLKVETAGKYTFGGNSDDGQMLAIDVNKNGLDLDSSDVIILDDTNHGAENRLHTCGLDVPVVSCVDEGIEDAINLGVGEYDFEYWYFEGGGGSSGEVFYASGQHEIFDPASFAPIGDKSHGIGVADPGITVSLFRSSVAITNLTKAQDLVNKGTGLMAGFPQSSVVPTADVYNTGRNGNFDVDHPLPGVPSTVDNREWSEVGPTGWTRQSNLPPQHGPEYPGWTFMRKDFWIAEQGNQDRSTFGKGTDMVAIVDPDAIDDFADIDVNKLKAYMSTPVVSLAGVPRNSVKLEFDSSFRPYANMVGLVDVSFDEGKSWSNLLTLTAATTPGGQDSLSRSNESIQLSINNPADGTIQIRFGMEDAGNDWWWAVDSVRLTTAFTGNPLPGINATDAWAFSTAGSGLLGDINGNGEVDFPDFLILSDQFGKSVAPGTGGDLDKNGLVEFVDFLILSANFGKRLVPSPPVAVVSAANVSDDQAFAISSTDSIFALLGNDTDSDVRLKWRG